MVKYKMETYKKFTSYTSYNNLSLGQAKAIQDSCFDNIPKTIETNLGVVEIYNSQSDFLPYCFCYAWPNFLGTCNDCKVWSHNKKSDWYTHVPTGIKVKKEVVKSPNYDKTNGYGECTITVTVKIPVQDGRGQNPNSHHNKKKSQASAS